MHKKWADRGFVAISVSVDDPTEKESLPEALKFLREKKATFQNFLLDEEAEVWQKKLDIVGVPCVVVFNREGKIEQKFTAGKQHAEIEKLADKLLKQK